MKRTLYMAIAVICYFAFFGSFLYLIGFVGNFPGLPNTVDRSPTPSGGSAMLVNLGLIALFGLQHSVMARSGFKTGLTRVVPPVLERSVFCLASAVVLVALYCLWQPMPALVWDVQSAGGRMALWLLFAVGWLIVLVSTFLLNHFELFGLAQPWRNLRGTAAPVESFSTPGFYRAVRHPIYAGFVLAFWATPTMTQGHLLLAAGMTVYILIGIRYEERDLVARFGAQYSAYKTKVGMLFPRFGGGS